MRQINTFVKYKTELKQSAHKDSLNSKTVSMKQLQ